MLIRDRQLWNNFQNIDSEEENLVEKITICGGVDGDSRTQTRGSKRFPVDCQPHMLADSTVKTNAEGDQQTAGVPQNLYL